MTKEEAVELLLDGKPWLPCPRRVSSDELAINLTDEEKCPDCGGRGHHWRIENARYAEACLMLGLETPKEAFRNEAGSIVGEHIRSVLNTPMPRYFQQITEAIFPKDPKP
jgi:hypothetical protein